MKVLVTGASGRVGRAVYVRLRRGGHDVVGLDRSPSSTADLVGDVAEPDLLGRALRGVEAVVHTAAYHAPHVGIVDEPAFERVNVGATSLLARLSAEQGIRRFVFTSTTALYGDAATPPGQAGWVDESLEPRPRTVYHRTKLAAESHLENLARESGMGIVVLRMARCFPESAPLMAVYRLHRGIDARDVAAAHSLAIESSLPGFRRYVISGATAFCREDVAELLRDAPRVLARRAPELVEEFTRRAWPLPSSIDRVYCPAAAMQALGWRPRFGFREVLRMLDDESSEVLPPQSAGCRTAAAADG